MSLTTRLLLFRHGSGKETALLLQLDAKGLMIRVLALILMLIALAAGSCDDHAAMKLAAPHTRRLPVKVDIVASQTLAGLGAGQGVFIYQDKVYLYGDAEVGVIREYDWDPENPHHLAYTGLEIRLTRNGEDIAPHPTGLTHQPGYGTFLGNTVRKKGTIWHIDWERAKSDGNLEHAVLNRVDDDRAINGTRPEFVRYDDRWLIATADYGRSKNALRLYDPVRLATVSRTSAAGVLITEWPCGPWVQTLHWIDQQVMLVLVQNQTAGRRYRLTFAKIGETDDLRIFAPMDFKTPLDELEGWGLLNGSTGIFFNSSRQDNVLFGPVRIEAQ